MSLLIHSMAEFWEIIETCLEKAGAKHLVEIGAEFGGTSNLLAQHAARRGGTLTCIDPCPQPDFLAWCAGAPDLVKHVERPSLEALTELADVDAWLIDGDHNWYTVHHELKAIHAACRRDGRPLLVFLHDVGWPTAHRDSYYAPDRIPAEYRQPYDFDAGVTLESETLVRGRGFRGMGHWAWSTKLGGPCNGVFTAIKDFLFANSAAGGKDLGWARIPAVFGLGVLFDSDASWSADVAQVLLPFHENPLLARLELNRLRNYLAVIEWQDRTAELEANKLVSG
ncbi:MAG TPA: class I SAM-dependent methyltransferase [Phenylobacterium sp.]|uniref:class I SAM-dependent methyltransferase n=1 Tax=Phenylobacterium sp. TaxID=1871053 RepID=UPI002C059BC6|nr:class I SAM-dependent methyltransferase [Phenylobacterium sp.]HSV03357.1 class I SAM-dependent methyltransferase [Phenylobacterium sp.]